MVQTSEWQLFEEASLSTGTWHHVAVGMRNKGRAKNTHVHIYLDGQELASRKLAYPGVGPPQAANSDVASQICFRLGTGKRQR